MGYTTKVHEGCGGILLKSGFGYKCKDCGRYTNEIKTKEV